MLYNLVSKSLVFLRHQWMDQMSFSRESYPDTAFRGTEHDFCSSAVDWDNGQVSVILKIRSLLNKTRQYSTPDLQEYLGVCVVYQSWLCFSTGTPEHISWFRDDEWNFCIHYILRRTIVELGPRWSRREGKCMRGYDYGWELTRSVHTDVLSMYLWDSVM